MRMRPIAALALALLSCCRSPEAPALHPALTVAGEIPDELRLSFFADFDERSFRALAERAFTDEALAVREEAARLLDAVVWNWYPELPQREARRRYARSLLPPLTRHADARVRVGIWRLARHLYQDPSTAAPASEAFAEALVDPDPDVRLAALRTALDLQSGHTGGCIVEEKKTSFTLRAHLDRLSTRLFLEPDLRVRVLLLRALLWCGRGSSLPFFARYFIEADRRDEIPLVGMTVRALFEAWATELQTNLSRSVGGDPGAWDRFRAFTESLVETRAARRNGIVLLLSLAAEMDISINEDRGLLRRVIEGLESDEEGVREEDLLLIVKHWRVMDPSKVVHRPNDFLRLSSVPDILKGLRALLASNP